MATRTIRVDYDRPRRGRGRARAAHVRDGRVDAAQLRIFEPPRFFEALLRGRGFTEAPDITARICGICPVAYQMSAVHAMEDALGVAVDRPAAGAAPAALLRRMDREPCAARGDAACAGFPRLPDAIQMAREHGDAVRGGLALKKAGNALMRLLGGREIHPVNVRVGGFYRVPTKAELGTVAEELKRARDIAVETVALGGEVSVSGVRARLRVRGAAAQRRIPVQRGPHRLEPRPRYRRARLRQRIRGAARRRIRPRCNRC